MLVILAASICVNPYLASKNPFDILLKQSNPMYVNTQMEQINQNDKLNFLISFQSNLSFSFSVSLPSILSNLLAYFSIIVNQFPQIKDITQNTNPTVMAAASEVSSASGGIE